MGRFNGKFRYKVISDPVVDPETGFIEPGSDIAWKDGGCCQIEYNVPARQRIGTDGQVIQYTYDLFIPKGFNGDLEIGTEVEVTDEQGNVHLMIAQGVDNLNRRYTELWG